MIYYKTIGDDGFISVSTVNADGDGNISQTEYNQIMQMIKDAPTGRGVVEIDGEYAYAEYSVVDDVSPDEIAEALEGIL